MAVPGGILSAAGTEPVDLGTAENFGALAGGAISGTGHVEGDVGSGTGAIAPAITSSGTIYPMGDAVVMTALDDFATAYNEGFNRPYDILLSAAAYELGGKTLSPGVYKIGGAATLATPVTLNAKGDPDAVFIIQIEGALSATASVGNVLLTNEAQSANIFWIVEGAVSMGASTHMEGTVLGGAAIAFGASTTINGRIMAGTAAGTIAIDTTILVPVEPSLVGGRVWLDANDDGIQDPAETTGFANVPVALLQFVSEGLTIDLGTAAQFGALAVGAISGTGHVEKDVGSGAGAIAPAITSDGTIYSTGDPVATIALDDVSAAYNEGKNRSYDVLLSAAAYELGGTTLTPGVYKIGGAATLATPVTLDADGDPEGVFIIQIVGAFSAAATAGNVLLTNEAQSANIFWIVDGAVSMGAGAHMEGTILGGATISFGAAATMNGRALAGSAAGAIALDTTTISAVTGTPPVGDPPPVVVADTVTDADGNYLFEGVQPGIFLVRWDLSNVTTDYRITSDGMSGDVGEFVSTAAFEVQGGTTHLGMNLGLVETLPAIQAAAMDELDSALAIYLEANYYTFANWTALKAAKADGDTAIQEAPDPEGVAEAKEAALAAMAAVPTFAETLKFTDISRSSAGDVTLVLRTAPHYPLTLQTSTDLQSWSFVTSATPDTESWTFVHDAETANGPKRFYRAFFDL
ncbi:MAG: DUF3494 domain-containing protein [Verrucomicrobia bacterium]|nr:DUF3494 domain-containing protein [Verrucomicrobiota bacterium]MCH8512841.1 ice-binding family protein [Kiritimatiellia bacterium]